MILNLQSQPLPFVCLADSLQQVLRLYCKRDRPLLQRAGQIQAQLAVSQVNICKAQLSVTLSIAAFSCGVTCIVVGPPAPCLPAPPRPALGMPPASPKLISNDYDEFEIPCPPSMRSLRKASWFWEMSWNSWGLLWASCDNIACNSIGFCWTAALNWGNMGLLTSPANGFSIVQAQQM